MRPTLSPRELAATVGVSESSIKRWADDGLLNVTRTAGGHRRIARSEAIRFVRDQHLHLVDPVPLGLPEISAPNLVAATVPETLAEQLFDLLSRGESSSARGVILLAYLQGASVAELCDRIIAPAMHRLGELWEHSERGIYIEHRSTDICIQALNQLRSLLPEPAAAAPIAVGGAPGDDVYLIPSLAAATVLVSEGFSAVNLGPNTPMQAIDAAVSDYSPRLVWLSLSSPPEDPASFGRLLKSLEGRLAERGVKLIIGGRAATQLRQLKPSGALLMSSMSELVAFARGVLTTAASGAAAG